MSNTESLTTEKTANEIRIAAIAEGLRALATFMEAHPELAVPFQVHVSSYPPDTKEAAAAVAHAFGSCEKDYSETVVSLSKRFGLVTYAFYFMRAAICERIQVGVKHIPELKLEAREETIIPASEEPIFEWHCGPILDGGAK